MSLLGTVLIHVDGMRRLACFFETFSDKKSFNSYIFCISNSRISLSYSSLFLIIFCWYHSMLLLYFACLALRKLHFLKMWNVLQHQTKGSTKPHLYVSFKGLKINITMMEKVTPNFWNCLSPRIKCLALGWNAPLQQLAL